MIDEAKAEARRTLAALVPYARRGVAIVGLEPSCMLGMRDEFLNYGLGEDAELVARHAMLFEEFLVRERAAGRLTLPLKPLPQREALLHGHCHQKAFAVMTPIQTALGWIPGLATTTVASGCCGMAGAFGYQAEHHQLSMQMAEQALLPAVRSASNATLIVADGFSCRHQIRDGARRDALHVASVLAMALD
jgi:Fe-S oxidoreductase